MKNLKPPFLALLLTLFGAVCALSACSSDPSSAPDQSDVLSLPEIEFDAEQGRETPALSDSPPASVLGSSTDRSIIFVRANGNDSADGASVASAVRTTQRAMQLIAPSSVIDIGPGRFAPITIKGINATANAPLRIRGAGADKTILSSNAYDQKAGVHIIDSSHISVEALHATKNLWGVYVDHSSHVDIRNIAVTDIGQEAVRFAHNSSHVALRDSTIDGTGRRPGSGSRPHDWYGEGVYVGTGAYGGDTTNNVVISGNEISNTTAEAIDMKPETYNLLVEENRIHHINTIHSGAVTLGIGRTYYRNANAVIRNNIIHDVTTRSQWNDGNAITLSASALVYNNIIWNTQDYGVVVQRDLVNHDANDVVIVHNTIDDTGLAPVMFFTGPDQADLVLTNNIGPTQPGNIASKDSMFLDPSIRDYRLREGSAALDIGQDSGLDVDKAGHARPQGGAPDMGALERPVNGFESAPAQNQPTTQAAPLVRESGRIPQATDVAGSKVATSSKRTSGSSSDANPDQATPIVVTSDAEADAAANNAANDAANDEVTSETTADATTSNSTKTTEPTNPAPNQSTQPNQPTQPAPVVAPVTVTVPAPQAESTVRPSGPHGALANAPSIELGYTSARPTIGNQPDELAFADPSSGPSPITALVVGLSSLLAGALASRQRIKANRY